MLVFIAVFPILGKNTIEKQLCSRQSIYSLRILKQRKDEKRREKTRKDLRNVLEVDSKRSKKFRIIMVSKAMKNSIKIESKK
jgi:hypothetical protein